MSRRPFVAISSAPTQWLDARHIAQLLNGEVVRKVLLHDELFGPLRTGGQADIRMRLPTVLCVSQAVATPSETSEIPGQAQSSELGAPPLGVECLGEVRFTEEEGETAMSHGEAECGHADEGLGAD